ncbi:hypothetical protein NC652_023242 [Populus alba x Populus x berolinensis]|nr:hypothetical protein NC652_023242 [Populus alba x Populus x berolinensis]
MPKKVESLVREKADAEDEKLSSREFIYEQKRLSHCVYGDYGIQFDELYFSYLLLVITLKLYIRFHFSGYVILDTGPSLRTAQEPQDNPRKYLYDHS